MMMLRIWDVKLVKVESPDYDNSIMVNFVEGEQGEVYVNCAKLMTRQQQVMDFEKYLRTLI